MLLKKATERVRDLNNQYVPITINGVIGERLVAVGSLATRISFR